MIDDQRIPTDDAIERGIARRAPHGPEAALLAGVMAEVVGTPQVTRWGPAFLDSGAHVRRRSILLAVAAAIALIAMAAFASGFGSEPRIPALVVTGPSSPTPAAEPSQRPTSAARATATPTAAPLAVATASPTAPPPCSPEALVAKPDPSGSVTTTDMTFDGLDKGRMAYLTQTKTADGYEVDAWIASHGAKVATRIATFTGLILDVGRVGDLTPGVSGVLVSIGHSVASSHASSCSDLYLLAPDGSSLRRLTDDPFGIEIGASRLSPDGSHVAFESTDTDPVAPVTSIVVGSVKDPADRTVLASPCNDPSWSPDGQEVAVHCRAADGRGYLEIYDLAKHGWTSSGSVPGDGEATAIAWSPDGRHIVTVLQPPHATCPPVDPDATCDGSRHSSAITSATLDTQTGAWEEAPWTTPQDVRAAAYVRAISPDLRHVLVQFACCKLAWGAVVDLRDGALSEHYLPGRFGWSLDGNKVVGEASSRLLPDSYHLPSSVLEAQPLDGTPSEIASLPSTFMDGPRAYAIEIP